MQIPMMGAQRRLVLVLSAALLFNIVPQALTSDFRLDTLLRYAAYTAIGLTWVAIYSRWLQWNPPVWARAGMVLLTWALAVGIPYVVSGSFLQVYLALLIAVQFIFATIGMRSGLAMLALALGTHLYYMLAQRQLTDPNALLMWTTLATLGLLTWFFMYRAREAEEHAHRLADEVTALNRLMLAGHDADRRKLAQALHDGPMQSMAVEVLAVGRARRKIELGDHAGALEELEYLREVATGTTDALRRMVRSLGAMFVEPGLEPALRTLAHEVEERTGVQIVANTAVQLPLSRQLQNCVYQLSLEALSNVAEHANATEASLSLVETAVGIELLVRDNGEGLKFEETLEGAIEAGQIGLLIMRERAAEHGGTMQVRSAPGEGTEVLFRFPREGTQPE